MGGLQHRRFRSCAKRLSLLTFQSVAVLGTGATARSALAAFQDSNLMLWGRDQDSAKDLSKRFDASNQDLMAALSADLVVSTIPGIRALWHRLQEL